MRLLNSGQIAPSLIGYTGAETVHTPQSKYTTNLGVVFRIRRVQCDRLQVELAIQVHNGGDVLKG